MSNLPLVSIFTGNSNSGSACIDELFKRYSDKVRVRGVFRSEEKAKPFKEKYPNLEVVTGADAYKPETMVKAFQGAHYSLIVTPHDPTKDFSDDAKLTANMINSAVENGVTYIVLVASFTVSYMEHMSIIGSRFLPSEQLLEKLGKEKNIKWTVLRGGCFMENVLPIFKKTIQADSSISYPNLLVPWVDTKDIGRSGAACFAAADINVHNQKHYEMNGPEIFGIEKAAQVLSKVLGKEIKYNIVPKEAMKKTLPEAVSQIFEYMLDHGETAIPFTQDVKNLTGQNNTFEDFIRDHKDYFLS